MAEKPVSAGDGDELEFDRPEPVESLVVGDRVRRFVQRQFDKAKISSDFLDELNQEVQHLLMRACERCQQNGRTTVQPRDL